MKLGAQNKLVFFLFLFFLVLGQNLPAETNDLTLKDSLDLAMKNSPQILAARENLKAASARLGQAVSLAIPHVSLDASYGRNYQQPVTTTISIPGLPPSQFSTTPDEAAKVTSYSVSLRQNVFLGGKMWLAIDAAGAGDQLARQDLRQAEADLDYRVTEAYFNLIKSEKVLNFTREAVANLKKYSRQMDVFYRSGISTRADSLRVETELAGMQANEISARSGVKMARISFNSLLGKKFDEEVKLSEENYPGVDSPVPDLPDLLKLTYENRPEWMSFQLAKKITGSAVGYAYSGYLPNMALAGSMGKTITDYSNAGQKYDLDNWRVFLAASWNIFDGLETPFKVAEAQANLAAIKAQEKTVSDGINLEVTAASLNLDAARERLEASRIAEDLARRAYRMSEVNFQSNIGTSLALLDAETALHQAQTNYYSAQFDYQMARVKINKAVGKKIF